MKPSEVWDKAADYIEEHGFGTALWNDEMIDDKEQAVAWLRASAAEMRDFGL
jgi:hypothetical protein